MSVRMDIYPLKRMTIGAGPNQIPAAAGCDGAVVVLTDAADGGDTYVGGGTTHVLCESNGTEWEVLSPPVLPGTQTVYVFGTKAYGTVYQNTGGTSRFVSLSIDMACPPVSMITGWAYAGPTALTMEQVGLVTSNLPTYDITMQLQFWVLPGYYYKVDSNNPGAMAIMNWVEWQ